MKEYVEVPAPIPESLLVKPCKVVGVGRTVDSLVKGYAYNTTCVGKYEATLDGIIQYNDTQKGLKDGNM